MPGQAVANWGFAPELTEKDDLRARQVATDPPRLANQVGSDHDGPECQVRVARATVASTETALKWR
jgi:hypothetical protein